MFFEVLIVNVGEISPEVRASAFTSLLSRLCHEQANGEHVLAFPAFG